MSHTEEQPHMNPLDKELIEEKFKNVYLKIQTNHNETKILLEQILEQTLKTNGRVNVLEKETDFVRSATRFKKWSFFGLIGIMWFLSVMGGQMLIKFIF